MAFMKVYADSPTNISCQPGGDCYLLGFVLSFVFFSCCTMGFTTLFVSPIISDHFCLFAVHFFQASNIYATTPSLHAGQVSPPASFPLGARLDAPLLL